MPELMERLKSFDIVASDGDVGKISDLLFDDAEWAVRHLVVSAGSWLDNRKVLLSPHSVEEIDRSGSRLKVSLTQQQIREAPSEENDLPVSRQYETSLYDYYGWPYYWTGPYLWGPWTGPGIYPPRVGHRPLTQTEEEVLAARRRSLDPHLRSFNEVNGYGVKATDGAMGDIEDMVLNTDSWEISYFVVDTSKFWLGKNVLLPPRAVRLINWDDSSVYIDITRDRLGSLPELKSLDDLPDESTILSLNRPSTAA